MDSRIDNDILKSIAIDSLAAHGRYLKYSELRIPEEIGDSDESAYIFPACGHVYGFHKGFLNRYLLKSYSAKLLYYYHLQAMPPLQDCRTFCST